MLYIYINSSGEREKDRVSILVGRRGKPAEQSEEEERHFDLGAMLCPLG